MTVDTACSSSLVTTHLAAKASQHLLLPHDGAQKSVQEQRVWLADCPVRPA